MKNPFMRTIYKSVNSCPRSDFEASYEFLKANWTQAEILLPPITDRKEKIA